MDKQTVEVPDVGAPDVEAPDVGAPERPVTPKRAPLLPKEVGGVEGPEPTRYGDWQHKGRVTDF